MKLIKTRRCQWIFFWVLLFGVVLLLSDCKPAPTPTLTAIPSPSSPLAPMGFKFTIPEPGAVFKASDIITIRGTYQDPLSNASVWIFLKDVYGGFFLQSPAVELYDDGTWEAGNIKLQENINSLVAVYVETGGDNMIRDWVKIKRFGKIEENEIKDLPGYRELARVKIAIASPLPPTPIQTEPLLPTPTPTPEPTPAAISLLVADFNDGIEKTKQDGAIGVACPAKGCLKPDTLVVSYVVEGEHKGVLRLEYSIKNWASFWMKLQGADLSQYSKLLFDLRTETGYHPKQLKIELKRANGTQTAICYVGEKTTQANPVCSDVKISDQWQTVSVDLSAFYKPGFGKGLSAWSEMEELVFTFEAQKTGGGGVLYLDNITFFKP